MQPRTEHSIRVPPVLGAEGRGDIGQPGVRSMHHVIERIESRPGHG
jgi:hypothetical protein